MTKTIFKGWLARVFAAATVGILAFAPVSAAMAEDAAHGSDIALVTPAALKADVPTVLSDADIDRYQRIFAVQESGQWKIADGLIGQLDNDVLMGHVLFQRYMHPRKYRSKYKELKDWMAAYADHPSATRVYKLALKRRPSNWKYPAKPQRLKASGTLQYQPSFKRIHVPSKKASSAQRREARNLRNKIRTACAQRQV